MNIPLPSRFYQNGTESTLQQPSRIMRYLFLFSLFTFCHAALSQEVKTNIFPKELWFQETLAGEGMVRGSSIRPAAKAYYILYASALDHYSITNKVLLTAQPILARLVVGERIRIFNYWENYKTHLGDPKSSEGVGRFREIPRGRLPRKTATRITGNHRRVESEGCH